MVNATAKENFPDTELFSPGMHTLLAVWLQHLTDLTSELSKHLIGHQVRSQIFRKMDFALDLASFNQLHQLL